VPNPPAPHSLIRRLALPAALLVTMAATATAIMISPTQAVSKIKPLPVDLETATIAQLQQALSARKVTSEQLVDAYLERIKTLNSRGPSLNAVRVLNPRAEEEARKADRERSRGRANGPMYGIPVLVKDNIDVKGLPTTAGALALQNSAPSGDAFLVGRLRAAGAIILGKTNLTEFANFTTAGMPSGYSGLGGQVLNPTTSARPRAAPVPDPPWRPRPHSRR
jgi:amidase